MLPALFGLFVAAACSLVERALCPIAQTWLARRMSAPLRFWSRSPPSHPFSLRSQHRHHIPPACDRYRALPDSRPGDSAPWRCRPPIPPSHPASLRSLSCPPDSRPAARTAPELASLKTQNARPAPRTRHRALSAMRSPPIAPRHPAPRRTSPRRAGPAAVPAIPAKWCGDTIAHTRKLRF